MNITRRDFLKSTGIIAAGIPLSKVVHAAPFIANSAAQTDWRIKQIPSICALCKSRCLILGSTNGSKLTQIHGNPQDPFTQGRLCAKGYAAIKTLYDPDRLKYPLKRVGPRGKGQWRRISWGEAIDTIADKLEKSIRNYGPQSVALMGNGPSSRYIVELFRELKIERISNVSRELCRQNRDFACQSTFGQAEAGQALLDFSKADCIVLFGSHFGENMQLPEVRQLSAATARGAKLVVVDPRMSVMAAKADYHLMIRPGTDSALLLGWINSIIQNRFYNGRFVQEFTEGFDVLAQKSAEFPLDRVAALTDLPIEELKGCLELIATAAPNVLFYPGNFSAWYGNDYQRLKALTALRVLTAQQESFADYRYPRGNLTRENTLQTNAVTTSAEIIREVAKGEVKILGAWGQNPFRASPNPYRTMAAYEKAEFTFCCDIYPTEAALYSDIILPEATFLERMDGIESWRDVKRQVVALRYPTVEPLFESKGPYWIVKQLSSRLGKGRTFRYNTVTERVDADLREMHLSVGRIRRNGGLMALDKQQYSEAAELEFPTPSKKIEFLTEDRQGKRPPAPPDFIFSSLPPTGFTRLLNGRSPVHSGVTLNNPWLVHEIEENELWLNDRVASKLHIKNGDRLFLENQDGIRSVVAVKIKVTPGIRVDCVFMAHGFGASSPFLQLAFNRGVDDGSLMTRSSPDPTTGVRGIRGNFIRFVKDGTTLDIPQLDNPPNELKNNSRWWLDSFGSFERGAVRGEYV